MLSPTNRIQKNLLALPCPDAIDGARLRGYDFELLAKPLHPEELLTRIGKLIGPKNALQQLGRR